jgi:MtN3 and saliva related transmembrane protein
MRIPLRGLLRNYPRIAAALLTAGTLPWATHWLRVLSVETLIGFTAAFCTTISYVPQVRKCWKTHSTGDLSLKMILLLATSISLWVVYGVLKSDMVIIAANSVSLVLLLNLLSFKLKEIWSAAH